GENIPIQLCHLTRAQPRTYSYRRGILGIAATLLPGGVTAHSRFKIPIDVDHGSTCTIKKGSSLARLMEIATLIVWDEAPMVHRLSFEAMDRTLCDIMNTPTSGPGYKPFGGKTVLLGGDFRQTLHVIPNGTRGDNVEASLTRSYLWPHCTLLELHTNMRIQPSDLHGRTIFAGMTFSEWVLAVGDGKMPSANPRSLACSDSIHIPPCFVLPPSTIVAPTNAVVREINDYILSLLPGESKIYLSSDMLTTPGPDQASLEIEYPTEFLNGLSFNGIPEHQLHLKKYAIVMLLRNLNPSAGLCNGTRILITHLGTHVVRGLIVGGCYEGTIAVIPRIQYPLRICYAMTINKSQGQTLEQIGIYLHTPVFSHGQLYVALSRVRSASGIHIAVGENTSSDSPTTRNIVYAEVFHDLYT
ncbi:ATP-dependent DNA helicase PIF1, partial [Linum grandiflorum]